MPPPIIWRKDPRFDPEALGRGADLSASIPCPAKKAGPRSRSGCRTRRRVNDLPWDPSRQVEIPNTGIIIQGHIDRLDLSGDDRRARVIDYKTGRLNKKMADVVVKGGSELQRCLYAFAVRTLLGHEVDVEASLLYPRAPEGEQALFPLNDVNAALDLLVGAIAIARTNVENGLALPGIDAGDDYNDFAFALPANASYLPRKRPFADQQHGRCHQDLGGRLMIGAELPDKAARTTALTNIDRSFLVEAGAGSGKTSIMAGRVAVLFAQGVEPKNVAAITFTEFAASELRIRIERFVNDLSDGTGSARPRDSRSRRKCLPSSAQTSQKRSKRSINSSARPFMASRRR